MTMEIDKISTINLAKNVIAPGMSKHIEMRFHYLREQVRNAKLILDHCRSEDQAEDILNEAMQVKVFKKLKSLMCVENLATKN